MEKRYDVFATAGRVYHLIREDLTMKEAEDFCDYYGWELDYNGGLMWDLEIEEHGYHPSGINGDREEYTA